MGKNPQKSYLVKYEGLLYNMPESHNFKFIGHEFTTYIVKEEIAKGTIKENDLIRSNYEFMSCCNCYQDGHTSYVTIKNMEPIILNDVGDSREELNQVVMDMVQKKLYEVEEFLLFVSNVHIFIVNAKVSVESEDKKEKYELGVYRNHPMKKWEWEASLEGINLERRFGFNIDKERFDEFRQKQNVIKYNRAFEYYIKSFYEYDYSVGFCLLCSALDAITGNSSGNDTKKRLAKYSCVLLCMPMQMIEIRKKMRHFYKLRSEFMHGRGNRIKKQNEIELREFVRRFLIAYYLFWMELDIKNEQQMLQKLDEIYGNPKLYIEKVPASYNFMKLGELHEKTDRGIFGMDTNLKEQLVQAINVEAVLAKSPEEDEKMMQNGLEY